MNISLRSIYLPISVPFTRHKYIRSASIRLAHTLHKLVPFTLHSKWISLFVRYLIRSASIRFAHTLHKYTRFAYASLEMNIFSYYWIIENNNKTFLNTNHIKSKADSNCYLDFRKVLCYPLHYYPFSRSAKPTFLNDL